LCAALTIVTAVAFLPTSAAHAAITTSGSVSAPDPSTWESSYFFVVGQRGDGTVTVNGGSVAPVIGAIGNVGGTATFLGDLSGVTGTINVDGAGSTLQNRNILYVGNNSTGFTNLISTGIINVTNGGTFIHESDTYVGARSGTYGIINVSGVGSTFTQPNSLIIGGNGTAWGAGNGEVNITNGGRFATTRTDNAGSVVIASAPGSTGIVRVDGKGSYLSVGRYTFVGQMGTGTLSVTNGGTVNSGEAANVGRAGTGHATVDGTGSAWNVAAALQLGGEGSSVNPFDGTVYSATGTGTLSISNGGSVHVDSISLYDSGSALTIDAGKGSNLKVGSTGTGAINNNGTIRLVAGAGSAAGTYLPIAAGTWNNNGTIQALGGKYNYSNHRVTIYAAATANGTGGASVAINNLATTQRVLITDSATGKSVGAGFQAGSDSLTLNAFAMGGTELTSLQGLLGSDQAVLSAWDFSTTGYTVSSTTPVYLSLWADTATDLSDLTIWHYDGSIWSKFDATDLAFDGTYASFSATSFSGYAVSGTAPVPVPSALFLLGPGLAGLAFMRRRIFSA
jgi:T5SS/PEP-CTERM-associated repeat protein